MKLTTNLFACSFARSGAQKTVKKTDITWEYNLF